MNAQEIFDTVAKHLFTQGNQARHPEKEVCAYRGDGGTACAVGCLIPDEAYHPDMEGRCAESLLAKYEPILPDFFSIHSRLLADLQDVHDYRESWAHEDVLKERLKEVADRYDLSHEVLKGLSLPKRTRAFF